MVRFVCPDIEVRLAGGREIHLRTLQPLALHIVNSIFLGDYLTSEGQAGRADLDMITDAGFEVEGTDTATLPGHRMDVRAAATDGEHACRSEPYRDDSTDRASQTSVSARPDLVAVRRRGAGTDLPPNA
jgi:biotin synthase